MVDLLGEQAALLVAHLVALMVALFGLGLGFELWAELLIK
jgi:hypothetical protein